MSVLAEILKILAALLVPVGVAGVTIALVIDLFLKRIKWWNGAWTVRANVVLNILASGLAYALYYYGHAEILTQIFELAPIYLAIIALIVFGPGGTWLSHKYFQTIGVSPSSQNDASLLGTAKG